MKNSVILKVINRHSLLVKFSLIFVLCVMLPIVYSGIRYTTITNRWIEEREQNSLDREMNSISFDISKCFETALNDANTILDEPGIVSLISRKYNSSTEFYNSLVNSGMRGYYQRYISNDDGILSINMYTDNYSITDCDLFEKLDNEDMTSEWYENIEDGDSLAIAVPTRIELHLGRSKPENNTISIVRHKTYYGDAGKVNAFVKINLNIARLSRILDNKDSTVKFYLYNDEYKYYVDPVKKLMLSYENEETDVWNNNDLYVYDSEINKSKYAAGWRVVCVSDFKQMHKERLLNTISTIIICSIFGLIALLLVYLIYYSNIRRIAMLQAGMRDMVNESFNKIDGDNGSDEIAELIESYNYMTEKMSTLINDVYKLEMKNSSMEIESVKAELKYLQSQVNPHFLFNILSAMHIEALKFNCKELGEQIYGLAQLLRRMLVWTDEFKPLSEEFDFIRIYLDLEKFRFRDKFSYKILAEENALKNELPIMLVQPLIENSCRHGLQGKKGTREIALSACELDGKLTIMVEDNGKGISPDELKKINESFKEKDFNGHVGLKNVYQRLKLYFGDSASMQIESEEKHWTRITITIKLKDLSKEAK